MALKHYDEVLGSCNAYLASEKPTVEILEIRGLARLARQNYSGAIDDYAQALGSAARPGPGNPDPSAQQPRLGLPFRRRTPAGPGRLRGIAQARPGPERRPCRPGPGPDPPGRLASRRRRRRGRRSAWPHRALPPRPIPTLCVQALFNAARIYAQAVEFAAGEVTRRASAPPLYRRYRAPLPGATRPGPPARSPTRPAARVPGRPGTQTIAAQVTDHC